MSGPFRDTLREALANPLRTLAEAAALVLLVAAGYALCVMAWAMQGAPR